MEKHTELVNVETGEIVTSNRIVRETQNYVIEQLPNGKFRKITKYQEYNSSIPETEEEKLLLFKVFNEQDNDNVIEMKTAIGKELKIKDVYIKPYESFDEETGENEYGCVTTLRTQDDKFYVTSSKAVYFTLQNMLDVFDLPLSLKVVGKKREKGIQIDLSLVGTK